MEQKEHWANEVLASIEGFEKARPSDTLFAKINSKITDKAQVKIIPMRKLYWVAVAASAVLALNVMTFSSEISESTNEAKDNLPQDELLTDFSIYK